MSVRPFSKHDWLVHNHNVRIKIISPLILELDIYAI
jgi:hypothetical protein